MNCAFRKEKINDRLYRIIDDFDVAMYLVIGEKYAVLIDTGYGFCGLKDFIETITEKKIVVLLSHGHIDHAMGIFEFDDVYLNEVDIPVFMAHKDLKYRYEFFKHENLELRYVLQKEKRIDFKCLLDKQKFDLGGLTIKCMNVKGHTKGSMVFLIEELRTMIFGDAIGPGTLLIEDFSANLSTYLRDLLKLKKYDGLYDLVLRNHGTYFSNTTLLDCVIDTVKRVLNGKDDREILNYRCLFPDRSNLQMFSANKKEKNLEGNVSYRIDKLV